LAESAGMALNYRLDLDSAGVARAFGAEAGRDAWIGGPLVPGAFAPVIVRAGREGKQLIRPMHWGYPAPGQSTEFAGSDPIRWVPTVRNLESPFWIGNLRHRELRCLIPATSFAIGTAKKLNWYRPADGTVFAFAGIWRDLTDMPVFAILCTDPPSGAGDVAMPLILADNAREGWLTAEWKEAQALVRPCPPSLFQPVE
jgi:putative SOS response-associated peptidase YedK